MRKLLVALACLVGLVLSATPALAYPGDYTVDNRILATNFYAKCITPTEPHYTYEQGPIGYYENTLDNDCKWFSVGDYRQVQYKSLASGIVYWSGCGRNLSHDGAVDPGYGWQPIGNDVVLLAKRTC